MIKNVKYFPSKHWGLTIFIIVIIMASYLFSDNEISISNTKWKCDWKQKKWICNVSFNLNNKSNKHINCNVSIRGQEYYRLGKAQTINMACEKYIVFKLNPEESFYIHESIECERKPDFFQINKWIK